MIFTYARLPAALAQKFVLTLILSLYLSLLFIEVKYIGCKLGHLSPFGSKPPCQSFSCIHRNRVQISQRQTLNDAYIDIWKQIHIEVFLCMTT